MFTSIFLSAMMVAGFLGWIALIAVIVIASRHAARLGKNVVQWALAAAAAYIVPSWIVKGLSQLVLSNSIDSPAIAIIAFLAYGVLSVIAGLLGCYFLRREYEKRHGNAQD